jgi:L-seryl-tRNA(Ser) seleniumtransferase
MKRQNQPAASVLRKLPSVDTLLKEPQLESYIARIGRNAVVNSVREAVEEVRKLLGAEPPPEMDEKAIYQKVIDAAKGQLEAIIKPYYRKAINATGIILHTGLGRAVLATQALRQIQEELSGYSLLQLDAETGERSKRDERIEWLLQQLTAAEAATVVNNNAAATAIVLNTAAKGREVIVSRGQLVEIGGSFRLPEVMAFSGAKLVEVGTTNKTHPHDYVNAITENTAAIMRVHPSNYRVVGFSSEVPLEDLVQIAHSRGLVMIDDVGSGALMDFSRFGFEPEPTLLESISKGADIVTSSADKLIGSSQGGIILGKANLINAIRKNQFFRIVRVGKLTLAAMEATLKLFLDEATALREVPTLQMLMRSLDELTSEAERLASAINKNMQNAAAGTTPGFSQTGSGSLPTQNLATMLVAIRPEKISAESLARRLRQYNPPIFTRIQNDQVLIDPRTLREGDGEVVAAALIKIISPKN